MSAFIELQNGEPRKGSWDWTLWRTSPYQENLTGTSSGSWTPLLKSYLFKFFLTTRKWSPRMFFLETCLNKAFWHPDFIIVTQNVIKWKNWGIFYENVCSNCYVSFQLFKINWFEIWIKKNKTKQSTFTEYFIRYSIANTAQMKLDGMIWASMYCHMHNNI